MSYKVIEAITVDQMTQDIELAEREGYRYVGSLTGQTGSVIIMHQQEGPKHLRPWTMARIAEMLREAVQEDGDHHKQWYLEQIAEGLEVALPDHEAGIAP